MLRRTLTSFRRVAVRGLGCSYTPPLFHNRHLFSSTPTPAAILGRSTLSPSSFLRATTGGGGDNNGKKKEDYIEDLKERWKEIEENDPSGWKVFMGAIAAILGISIILHYVFTKPKTISIEMDELKRDFIARERISRIVVDCPKERAVVYMKENDQPKYHLQIGPSFDTFEQQIEAAEVELGLTETLIEYDYAASDVTSLVNMFAHIAVMALFFYMVLGKANLSKLGQNPKSMIGKRFKPVEGEKKITFDNVAGLDEAKEEIMEFVKFLSSPEKYKRLGATLPKGALLVGPPGTGKTLLAKATAGTANVPFFSTSGSDFIEMFGGLGPKRVRTLFAEARKHKPCIIWIDEIDAIGKARSNHQSSNDERENTLNQLLVEMDGFETNDGVVVLAGTNIADSLDKALLRPGRFDRQVAISNPDISSRGELFKLYLEPLTLNSECRENIDKFSDRLAAMTPGFSGADIANICNEAALIAARKEKKDISVVEFEAAIERVMGGIEKKSKVLSKEEKVTVAYHEAGHAVTAWFLKHASPLLKVSIVPRGSAALGYAQYLPRDRFLQTTDQLLDSMSVALGGRVAEALTFGKITTGAQDDLDKVTKSAYTQIINYGMNAKVGHLSYGQFNRGNSFSQRPYSDRTAYTIDLEVRSMIENAYKRTEAILLEHKEGLEGVAQLLLKKEVINQEQVRSILGDRPFEEEDDKAEQYYKGFAVSDPSGPGAVPNKED